MEALLSPCRIWGSRLVSTSAVSCCCTRCLPPHWHDIRETCDRIDFGKRTSGPSKALSPRRQSRWKRRTCRSCSRRVSATWQESCCHTCRCPRSRRACSNSCPTWHQPHTSAPRGVSTCLFWGGKRLGRKSAVRSLFDLHSPTMDADDPGGPAVPWMQLSPRIYLKFL